MPMASIHKVGDGNLYHVHFFDPHEGHPGQGLPGHGHVDNTLPGMGGPVDPGYGRPGGGPHPGNRPPGSGAGIPDNELPDHPPPHLMPGYTLVMIRGPHGKWEYAAIQPGSPPPRPLPPQGGGGRPDQGLPGQGGPNYPSQGLPGGQPHPDQGLPGGQPPHVSGQPIPGQPPRPDQGLPPTPAPKPA